MPDAAPLSAVCPAATSRAAVRLYSAWFCPYAQRAWIALEEKAPEGYELFNAIEPRRGYYRDPVKAPELLAVSPKGLVPVLVDGRSGVAALRGHPRVPSRRAVVRESTVLLEYIDEAFDGGPALFPADVGLRAEVRLWLDWIGKEGPPAFFIKCLMLRGDAQREAEAGLTRALLRIEESVALPYFLPGAAPTAVDLALFPFVQRLPVVAHYCGFAAPARCAKLRRWFDAMLARPAVAATVTSGLGLGAGGAGDKMVEFYRAYHDGEATSQSAASVRAGRNPAQTSAL